MASPNVVKLATRTGMSAEELEARQSCIVELLDLLRESLYLVIPIHGDEPMHWTVLTIKTAAQGSDEITSIEYCDF